MSKPFNTYSLSATPVLALHSSSSSGRQWSKLEDELHQQFQVITPDLPGYGHSFMARDHREDGLGCIANPIIDRLRSKNQPMHLVGHSLGAAVALKIAVSVPELVKSLIVYEPAAFHFLNVEGGPKSAATSASEIRQLHGLMSANIACGDDARAMRLFVDYWNGEGAWMNLPYHAKARMREQCHTVMSDFSASFSEQMRLEDLANLEIPTLIMMGLNSPQPSQDVALSLSSTIKNARLAILPELNHMAPITSSEWVNPRIREHLGRAERPMPNLSWSQQLAA